MPTLAESIPCLLCLSHVDEEAQAFAAIRNGRKELSVKQFALGDGCEVEDGVLGATTIQDEDAGSWDSAAG